MSDLRNKMLGLFMAGWLRIRAVTDPVHRGSESAGGRAAALTVRQLSTLLGNALVAEMTRLGFESLLILLSSPKWLESRISQRARSIAFEVQADERESWSRPVPIDVGNDSQLRGIPGGAVRSAVELFRLEGLTVVSASSAIRQTAQWEALAKGSRAFARPASTIVGSLEVMVANGGKVRDRVRAERAVRREYAAELQWLSTPDGQRAIAGRRLEFETVEVPDLNAVAAEIQETLKQRSSLPNGVPRLRVPGTFTPLTPPPVSAPPGRYWVEDADPSEWTVEFDPDALSSEQEAEAPAADAPNNEGQADAPEAPADTPKQKKSGSMGVLLGGLFAAGLGLTAWTRWRRRHG